MRLRALLLRLHRYAGAVFAAYLIVVCASGSLLVLAENGIEGFRDYPMERVAASGPKRSLAGMLRRVSAANPGLTIYHVLISCPSGCSYDFSMHDGADRRDVLVDPYSGRILTTVDWDRTFVGMLYHLHGELFGGGLGETIDAVLGLSATLMALTGVILWRGRSSTRPMKRVHVALGLVASAFLCMWSLTALAQEVWNEPSEPLPVAPAAAHRDIDELVALADRALPGDLIMVYPPHDGILAVRKRVPGDPDPYGYSYVAVNASTGAVARVYDARSFGLLTKVRTALYALHIGAPGGQALRYVYALVGLLPAILFITGFTMWVQRLQQRV